MNMPFGKILLYWVFAVATLYRDSPELYRSGACSREL